MWATAHVQEVATAARLSGRTSANPGRNHGIKISTCISNYKPSFFPPMSLGPPFCSPIYTLPPWLFPDRWWVEKEAQ